MKALPSLCIDTKDFTSKVADVLAQMLQLVDPQEYNIASNSLLQVLKAEPVTVVKCIFKQIHAENVTTVREKCIKFLVTKIKTLDKALYTSELEEVIIEETKKAIQVCQLSLLVY